MLEPLVAEARDSASRSSCKTLHGDPASDPGRARRTSARPSQIFIGRDRHRRVHELLFGSTLLELAQKATVPVTLVP